MNASTRRNNLNVLFYIKRQKLLKNGEAPICMRITVNGSYVEIMIRRSIPVSLWNQSKERIERLCIALSEPKPFILPEGEKLLDNAEICRMLNISKRTLQRYRSSGLPYLMLYHKTFYKESEVREFVMSNIDMFRKVDKSKLLKQ